MEVTDKSSKLAQELLIDETLDKLTEVFVSVKERIPPRVYIRAVAMHLAYIVAQSPDSEGYWSELRAQISATWDSPVIKALRRKPR